MFKKYNQSPFWTPKYIPVGKNIRDDSEGNVLNDHDPFLNPVYELNQPIDIDENK